jgi:hypothetical protein
MNFNDKALLARLNISQWTARSYDKKISKKVESEYNAHDAGRYNKVLIAKEAIKAITKAAGEARTFHYENTLPWSDLGDRILPTLNFESYSQKMRELRAVFEGEVNRFIDNYDSYVKEAKQRLNGMFNERDYPHIKELPRKYNFNIVFDPLPRVADFRVDISHQETEAIRANLQERLEQGHEKVTRDLWERLHKVVGAMVNRLSDEKAVFRDSLVVNIQGIVELLPRLNITGDLSLDKARREIEAKLCQHTPQMLRTNTVLRNEVAREAENIQTAMAPFMGSS